MGEEAAGSDKNGTARAAQRVGDTGSGSEMMAHAPAVAKPLLDVLLQLLGVGLIVTRSRQLRLPNLPPHL